MTQRQKHDEFWSKLIADLKARAAVASGTERERLLTAVRYYEARQP